MTERLQPPERHMHPADHLKLEGRRLMTAGVGLFLLALTSDRVSSESITTALNRAGNIEQEILHQPPHVIFNKNDVKDMQDPLTGIVVWAGVGSVILANALQTTKSWDTYKFPDRKENDRITTAAESEPKA